MKTTRTFNHPFERASSPRSKQPPKMWVIELSSARESSSSSPAPSNEHFIPVSAYFVDWITSPYTHMWEWRRMFTLQPAGIEHRKLCGITSSSCHMKVSKSSAIKCTFWCHPIDANISESFSISIAFLHAEEACAGMPPPPQQHNTKTSCSPHFTFAGRMEMLFRRWLDANPL